MTATQPYADWLRDHECGTKARHLRRRNARAERRRLAREHRLKLSELSTYRCHWCGTFHVGTRNDGLVTTGYVTPEVWL